MLSKYEVTRVIGMRALHLEEGRAPCVQVERDDLRCDSIYVAALELYEGKLNAKVSRGGAGLHVSRLLLPSEVATLLNTRDGRSRTLNPTCPTAAPP